MLVPEVAVEQIVEDNNGVVKTVLSFQTSDSLDVAKEAGLEIFSLEKN